MSYSSLFQTIHDESKPVGHIGRGTHYSVLEALLWQDTKGNSFVPPKPHSFAVIWDEDHDERVIGVARALYLNGLLSPVRFIGERKASLRIVVDELPTERVIEEMNGTCGDVVEGYGDCWDTDIVLLEDGLKIIADRDETVTTYLENITNLWCLGGTP